MPIDDLSKTIARAISETLQMSVSTNALEKDLAQTIKRNNTGSFDVNAYVDSFLARNNVQPNKQLQFRVRWLPTLQLIAANDVQKLSPNRLELFEKAVYRVYGTSSESSSLEFNQAWRNFTKSPTDRDSYLRVMIALKNLGVQSILLSKLNGAWTSLFVNRKPGEISSKRQNAIPNLGVVASYEAVDKKNHTVHVITPAPADGENVSLAGYRISELGAAHRNAINSPISIVSAYPGFNADGSFGRMLVQGLSNSKFKVLFQNFSQPNMKELDNFERRTIDKNRAIVFKIKGNVSHSTNTYMSSFLRERFFSNDTRKQQRSRIIFLIETSGSTTTSAANSLVPHLNQILKRTMHVPTIGINLKYLSKRQVSELFYGSDIASMGKTASANRLTSLIEERVPMIPSTLFALKRTVTPLKEWGQIEAAVNSYGAKLRTPRPNEMNKLLLMSSAPTDDSSWMDARQSNFSARGYSVKIDRTPAPYDSFEILVEATSSNASGNGSNQGNTGSADYKGNPRNTTTPGGHGVTQAKNWGGFFEISSGQIAPPPGLLDKEIPAATYTLDPNVIPKTPLPGTIPIQLAPLPGYSAKSTK